MNLDKINTSNFLFLKLPNYIFSKKLNLYIMII